MIPTHTRLQYANGYLDLGMISNALSELKAIDASDNALPETRSLWIRLYMERQSWKQVAVLAQNLAEDSPEFPQGWVHWAYALREMERIKEAKEVASRGIEQHPTEAVLWFNLACYQSLLGEFEEASDNLDKAIGLEKAFESEAVDDPDLDGLWNWMRQQGKE